MQPGHDTTKSPRWLLLATGTDCEEQDGWQALLTVQCRAYAALKYRLKHRVQTKFSPLPSSPPAPVDDESLGDLLPEEGFDGALALDVHAGGEGWNLVCRKATAGEVQKTEKSSSWESLLDDVGELVAEAIGEGTEPPVREEQPRPGLWFLYYLTYLRTAEASDMVVGAEGLPELAADELLGLLPSGLKNTELSEQIMEGLDRDPLASRPDWARLFARIAAILDPESPQPDRVLAELATVLDASPEEADRYFQSALEKAGEEQEAEIRLGWAKCLESLGKEEDAKEKYGALLDSAHAVEARQGLARLADARGDREAALEQRKEAVAASPENAILRVELAQALRDGGDLDQAHAEFRRALELDPGVAEVVVEHGRGLVGAGRPDLAVALFQHLLEVGPENPAAYLGLGDATFILGNFPVADECYRRCLDLTRDSGLRFAAISALARLLNQLGEGDEAAALWAEAQALTAASEADSTSSEGNA